MNGRMEEKKKGKRRDGMDAAFVLHEQNLQRNCWDEKEFQSKQSMKSHGPRACSPWDCSSKPWETTLYIMVLLVGDNTGVIT